MSVVEAVLYLGRRLRETLGGIEAPTARDESTKVLALAPGAGDRTTGRQACRILPMTSAAWRERKNQFDEKTGRRWPKCRIK